MWVSTNNNGVVNLEHASAITMKSLAFNSHVFYAVIYADKEYLYAINAFETREEAIHYIEDIKEKWQLKETFYKN